MLNGFEIAQGSVCGRDHQTAGKNNQDALSIWSGEGLLVAVVCDGCSAGKHSETGARVGARWITTTIAEHAQSLAESSDGTIAEPSFWEGVRADVLDRMRMLARSMGGRMSEVVGEYFLFTTVGFLMTPAELIVFSIGDGVLAVNGSVQRIGPFPENKPPYLAYGLVGTSLDEDLLGFRIHRRMPTEQVDSVLIGTDGVADLLELSDAKLPGKSEVVGPFRNFWTDDRWFENTDALRRRLVLMNTESRKPDWTTRRVVKEIGLLADDTTMVVLRRIPLWVNESGEEASWMSM